MADEQKPLLKLQFGKLMLLLVVTFVLYFFNRTEPQPPPSLPLPADKPATPPPAVFPGTAMLKNYGSTRQPPTQDLTDLHRVWENFTLLIKAPLPLGANEDIAAALLGKNPDKLVFVTPDAAHLNASGQLIDRWQSPLFFHAIDQRRLDIRSAGPDRQMWTADDLHRRYDGQFVTGEALNASSLFEATRDYRPRPNQ